MNEIHKNKRRMPELKWVGDFPYFNSKITENNFVKVSRDYLYGNI